MAELVAQVPRSVGWRILRYLSVLLVLLWGWPALAQTQKVAYFVVEKTEQEFKSTYELATSIAKQQLSAIEGVREHQLTRKDVRRLKKCKGKTRCLQRWLKRRGVFGIYYIKIAKREGEKHLGIGLRHLDTSHADRFRNQNLIWRYAPDRLNYELEVSLRRWLRPESLRGQIEAQGLTADTQLWIDETPVTGGLMDESWSRELLAGNHSLRAERTGYVPYAKNFEIHHREKTEIQVDWRVDPLHEVNYQRTEVKIGVGVAGVGALTWLIGGVSTLVVGAEAEKRAEAQMLSGESHQKLMEQGEQSALVANLGLGVVALAAGWCAYWGFAPEKEEP